MSDIERIRSIRVGNSVQTKHYQKLRRSDLPNLDESSPFYVNSTSTGSSKQNIKKFMAFPSLIAKFLDLSPSMQPSEVLAHRLAVTNSFDTKNKGLKRFQRPRRIEGTA